MKYKPHIWIDEDQLKIPGFWDYVFGRVWLEYTDDRVFDCSRRINLVTGETESSPFRRSLGVYESCDNDVDKDNHLNLEELLTFIRGYQNELR